MQEEELYIGKLAVCEKKIALQALKLLFEAQWNKKYPKWVWDSSSVTLFNQKDDAAFHNRNPTPTRRELSKRSTFLQKHKADQNWSNGAWDISKLAYAIIDAKVFQLDPAVSDNVDAIRKWRNELSHSAEAKCSLQEFTHKVQLLESYVNKFYQEFDITALIQGINGIRTVNTNQTNANQMQKEDDVLQMQLRHEQVVTTLTRTIDLLEDKLERQDTEIQIIKSKVNSSEIVVSFNLRSGPTGICFVLKAAAITFVVIICIFGVIWAVKSGMASVALKLFIELLRKLIESGVESIKAVKL